VIGRNAPDRSYKYSTREETASRGGVQETIEIQGQMGLNIEESDNIADARPMKCQVAGYGFLGLNSIYIALAWGFMPPFVPGFPKAIFWPLILVLILFLTKKILSRKTTWIKTLAVLSGLRFIASSSLILSGDFLPVVPYFLPCFLVMFYLLGRAGWNWP